MSSTIPIDEQRSDISIVEHCLKDLSLDKEYVYQNIHGLSPAALKHFGYDYFYMNLLAIFRNTYPPQRIEQIASDCLKGRLWKGWHFQWRLEKQLQIEEPKSRITALQGWNLPLIAGLLAPGRGLILCSHHYGLFRDLMTDLAILQMKATIVLDEITSMKMAPDLKALGGTWETPEGEVPRMRVVNVAEDRGASLKLLSALRRGETLLIFADGNTGLDGAWGRNSRSTIHFMGLEISVKHGPAMLSLASGAPILPLLAIPDLSFGHVATETPLFPNVGRDVVLGTWLKDTMQRIYEVLERTTHAQPGEWESSCFFHRWRRGATDHTDQNDATHSADVLQELRSGKTIILNKHRANLLQARRGSEQLLLVDVEDCLAYGMPAAAAGLLDRLWNGPGIDQDWLESQAPTGLNSSQAIRFLADLDAKHLTTFIPERKEVNTQ